MQINWKLRLQNKTTLIALSVAVIAVIYQVLAVLGITPSMTQNVLTDAVMLIIDALTALGVVVDPTTKGISDSNNAMTYGQPH